MSKDTMEIKQNQSMNKKNIDFRHNYDSNRLEIEDESPSKLSKEFWKKIGLIDLVALMIAFFLSFLFKVTNRTFFASFSLYILIIGGILLFYGSLSTIYQESPTMKMATARSLNFDPTFKKTDNFSTYLISSLILFLLSFFIH